MNEKILSKGNYQRIRSWVYRYARCLEIAKWRYFFENGSKAAIVEALSFYQNEDGGFGHALEFDCWNPSSIPAATTMAYDILASIGCDGEENPMIQGILRFVEKSDYCTERGWLWSVPSNNQHPCQAYYLFPNAPWFSDGWPAENYVNGFFIKLVLERFDRNSDTYKKHLRIVDYRISVLTNLREFLSFARSDIEQDIETNDWLTMIDALEKYQVKSSGECSALRANLLEITRDFANPHVHSRLKRKTDNKGVIQPTDLDEMVDELCANKPWLENGLLCEEPVRKLGEMGHIGYLWWMIISAIDTLKTLKENNRIES